MLETIKQHARSGLSSIVAVVLFVVMLPITIGLMLIMLFAGIVTLATVRHRLTKSAVNADWSDKRNKPDAENKNNRPNPPIEGSYTVVNK